MNTNEDTKQDSGSGSRRYSREERERFIREYEQSGMTQHAFAKERGLAISTFLSWLRRHRRPDTNKEPETSGKVTWEPLAISIPTPAWEIFLPDGITVRAPCQARVEELVEFIRQARRESC